MDFVRELIHGKPMTRVANGYHKDIQACVKANRADEYEKAMGFKAKVGVSGVPVGGAYNNSRKIQYAIHDPGFVTIKPGSDFGFAEAGPDGKVFVTIMIGSDISHANFQVYNGRNVVVDKDGCPKNVKENEIWIDTSGKNHTVETTATLDLELMSLAKSHRAEDSGEALQRYLNMGQVKKYFGTRGNAVGEMLNPQGICSTASDDIVVADSYNHRIQIFDVNGRVKGCFGGHGNAEGQFNIVSDVCVTSRGHIVASDWNNNRIQIFDEHGRFVWKFGGRGSGDGKLKFPWGVATDESGLVYVCDNFNHRVQVFSEEGKFVRKFGAESLELPFYLSVTSGSDGRVAVSDSSHRIQVFDSCGRHLLQFGTEGTDEGQFKCPRGVATDNHGNMIVCENNNNRVQVFTSGGSFVSSFGSEGSAPGQMKTPAGVCLLSDGRIALCDTLNSRVQIF